LEIGAGLGLVALALVAALPGKLRVSVSDCDRETCDNLAAEVVLNGHALAEMGLAAAGEAAAAATQQADDACPAPAPAPVEGGVGQRGGDGEGGGRPAVRPAAAAAVAVGQLNYCDLSERESAAVVGCAPFDLVVGSDVVFSESHAALADALRRLIRAPHGRGLLCLADGRVVSQPFSSWNRPILTEIYLCHACSCPEILRVKMARQGTQAFLRRCAEVGLGVEVRPLDAAALALARAETAEPELGHDEVGRRAQRGHSLYFVWHGAAGATDTLWETQL
jgi:hypothetical protein